MSVTAAPFPSICGVAIESSLPSYQHSSVSPLYGSWSASNPKPGDRRWLDGAPVAQAWREEAPWQHPAPLRRCNRQWQPRTHTVARCSELAGVGFANARPGNFESQAAQPDFVFANVVNADRASDQVFQ